MRFAKKVATLIAAAVAVPAVTCAGTIGGTYYAPQYDFIDFWNAADNKAFQVILEGNPFPNVAADEVARRLLPTMQVAKPRPNLTFTYDNPAEMPRPYYRLVLVFDYANDLGADSVCAGTRRVGPGTPGLFKLFAVYCRNDLSLSQTTAWTPATGPDDPRIEQLFRELFLVVFSDSMALRPNNGLERR